MEPDTSLDDDVHPAVVEALEDLCDASERPDLTDAVLVRVEHPELVVGFDALADQLLVARLEDVQRHAFGRKQHDAEREEADLHRG